MMKLKRRWNMEDREMFMKLSLAEMSELLARKLSQERIAAHGDASNKLEKLEAKRGELKFERKTLVAEAAYEKIRSLTPEETRECDMYSHDLSGSESDSLILHVPFEVPEAVKEIDVKIIEIVDEMARIREDAALQVGRDATAAKELDLAYLVARMNKKNKPVMRVNSVVSTCGDPSALAPVNHYPAFSGMSYSGAGSPSGYRAPGPSGASGNSEEEELKGEFPI